MSYRKLEIYNIAHKLVLDIHMMTITKLPKFEMYEEGSQIRKSSKSIKSNIVEGYGRSKYNKEYIRFLVFSLASNDETADHLENLYHTNSLKDKHLYEDLFERLDKLGRKINLFIQSIEVSKI
ncbi:MAG: four helix bundle protein [Calditrichia bacterium]|nr:four helix bundle protein [Calditrichia bacterium]